MAVDLAVTPDQHWQVTTADLAVAVKAAAEAIGAAWVLTAFPSARTATSAKTLQPPVREWPSNSVRWARSARSRRAGRWCGPRTVEVLSAELRALPVDVLMRRLHQSAAPFWMNPA
ncbi:MAG: hypothetical protein ACRDU5_05470 [Mycobacterium sp.]